jgi:predicted Fe-Mo cluster-binding NifX family protein
LWLYGEKVTDVIAGGMGQHAQSILVQNGVKVHMGAPQKSARELVEDCLGDVLETGANKCDH